jgi:trigger factor
MKVKVEKSGPCRKKLAVELPAEVVAAEYAKVRDEFARVARIPGFRQGRAPISLVAGHFRKEIEGEVKEHLVGRTYAEAVKQAELKPLMILDLQAEITPGKPFVYTVTLDILPDFKLPRYKNIPCAHKPVEVTDEDVQKALNNFLERMATAETVNDRPARKDDLIQVDYARKNGDAQKPRQAGKGGDPLANGRDFWLVIGGDSNFLPGFTEALVGMSIGDEKDITVKTSSDFRPAELSGRELLYHVRVKAIRERRLPAMNEAFFKSVGVQNEADLRGKIRATLLAEGEERETGRRKQEIADYLLARTSLDLPESIVQEEARYMFASLARDRLRQGLTRAQLQSQREELLTAAAKTAAEKVKLGYILHKIGDEEKIIVAENEVENEIQNMARHYRVPADELKKELEEKKEIDSIRHEIRMARILDFLLANSSAGEQGMLGRLFKGGKSEDKEK